jgi:hypothetical protein
VDSNGVVYYSSLFFSFTKCAVGGVELLRRNPATGSWSHGQIASNSASQFEDKPAITLSGSSVYESWTQFGSCSGNNVPSPIEVAQFPTGAASVAPSKVLSVPGSTYSQGSSTAADGNGGFWIAWEEWPDATASVGAIELAHYDGAGWATLSNGQRFKTNSPTGFTDLPSPLPGLRFRTDSFPALTVTSTGTPAVAWTSYDSGAGRAYLWTPPTSTTTCNPLGLLCQMTQTGGGVSMVGDGSGGDEFFPAIAADSNGGVYVSYGKVDATDSQGNPEYDEYLAHPGTASPMKVSTAPSSPDEDRFFNGSFIGDYNGLAAPGGTAHPIWTDIRGPDPSYPGWEMNAMTYAP